MVLYRIAYRDLCFAVVCRGGKVDFTAPCAKWMVGKSWTECQQYWAKRGAEILKLT
jgi:hypothetical protein